MSTESASGEMLLDRIDKIYRINGISSTSLDFLKMIRGRKWRLSYVGHE